MTYSFGSISLGSLIVALLDLLRFFLNLLQQQEAQSGDMVGAIFLCIASEFPFNILFEGIESDMV